MHVPDLPLYDNSAKVGFGLEARGVELSARTHSALCGHVALCAHGDVQAAFRVLGLRLSGGDAGLRQLRPAAVVDNAMAFMALAFYVVLASLAALVERVSAEARSGARLSFV